jgi:hypothetical protein
MASVAGGFAPFRFSTEHLPPERRLLMWHEALDRSLGGRRSISPISDDPFHVDSLQLTATSRRIRIGSKRC